MHKHKLFTIIGLILIVLVITILGIRILNSTSDIPAKPTETADQEAIDASDSSSQTPNLDSNSSDSLDGDQKVVITFAVNEFEKKLYEQLAEKFHQQNPLITVQVITPAGDFSLWNNEDLRPLAAAADMTFLMTNKNRLINNSTSFLDLSSIIDADSNFNADDFWENSLTACEDAEGRIIGIPVTLNLMGVFYDKEALQTAGIMEPTSGWTVDDLSKISQSLGKLQNSYQVSDASAWQSSILAPVIDQIISTAGGKIESSKLASSTQWYIDLTKSKKLSPAIVTDPKNSSSNTPLLWVGPLNASLPGSDEGLAIEKYGFAPFPLVADETSTVGSNVIWPTCAVVSAGTLHPREAWAWIDFLSRQSLDQSGTATSIKPSIPARRSVAEAFYPWNQLPEDAQKSIRFGLEHGWYGSDYPQVFDAVTQAFTLSLNGNNSLQNELASAVVAPSPTPNTAAIMVATPQSVQDLPEGTQVIRYLYQTQIPNGDKIFKDLAESYQQEHPGVIIQLSTNFSWPGGNPLPYVVKDFDCFTVYDLSSSSENKLLTDLTPLIAQEGTDFINDFYPGRIEAFTVDGKIYGLPSGNSLYILKYNVALLNQLGLQTPSADWTGDDFIQTINKVASSSQTDSIFGASGVEDYLIASQGIQWVDMTTDPPQINIDTPEAVQTVNWLIGLAKQKDITPLTNDYTLSQNLISSSQVVFWMSLGGVPGDDPFEIGKAPIPPVQVSGAGAGWISQSGQFISAKSELKQACWDWMKYVSEQPNVLWDIPARKSVLRSKEYAILVGEEMAKVYDVAQANSHKSNLSLNILPVRGWIWQALVRVNEGENTQTVLTETQNKTEDYVNCLSQEKVLDEIFTISIDNKPYVQKIEQCAIQADPGFVGFR